MFSSILESCALLFELDSQNAVELGYLFGLLFQLKNDLNPLSEENDAKNSVHTAKHVFGIEKTVRLIDNYKEEIKELISGYPDRRYAQAILDILEQL